MSMGSMGCSMAWLEGMGRAGCCCRADNSAACKHLSCVSVSPCSCNESCQLKFGDIDVELDCGMCIRKSKGSSGALLPESGLDDK